MSKTIWYNILLIKKGCKKGCNAVNTKRYFKRIHSNEVNLWSRQPKAQLKRLATQLKQLRQVMQKLFTEDRALFGRMAIISKNRSEFDL